MAPALWQSAGVPSGFTELWRQDVHSLAELVHLRARLRIELTGSPVVLHPELEHWSERMVLVVDELASNALRHGAAPSGVALSRSGGDWMVTVTDSAAGSPPQPAQGRDPARGGFGLYLVADLAGRHGWAPATGGKVVWAVLAADAAAS